MKKATCTCVFLISTLTQAAQNTGTVEYKEFGMAFTIETFDGFFKNDATAQEWREPLHLPHNATITSAGQESAVGEIHATWDAFIVVWETEDAAACAGFYTATGINIPPGAEIHEGREAIASFYSGLFKANASSRYRHETLSLEICGDTAVERGQLDTQRRQCMDLPRALHSTLGATAGRYLEEKTIPIQRPTGEKSRLTTPEANHV